MFMPGNDHLLVYDYSNSQYLYEYDLQGQYKILID